MKYTIQRSLIEYLIKHRNAFLGFAFLSMALNILLVITNIALVGHERIIVVPPDIKKTFWVGYEHVSPEYLSEMSEFFVFLRFNETPSSAQAQRDKLLEYVDPSNYEDLKMQMIEEDNHIVKEHISTAFYPVDVEVDAKKLTTIIQGDLVSSVGTTMLAPQRVTYQLEFSYHEGRLFVKAFNEVKQNAK